MGFVYALIAAGLSLIFGLMEIWKDPRPRSRRLRELRRIFLGA